MNLIRELIESQASQTIQAEKVRDFPPNKKSGGEEIWRITAEGKTRFVIFSYDFGGTLGAIEIVDENGKFTNEDLEMVFSEEIVERLWDMAFDDNEWDG